MERLTRKANGRVLFPRELDVTGPGSRLVCALVCRLAAYEDTNLTPEEIANYKAAEEAERLLVLPCKLGTTLYRLCTEWKHGNRFIRTVKFNENNFWRIVFGGEFGKTVFLTREDAEEALKEQEGKEKCNI